MSNEDLSRFLAKEKPHLTEREAEINLLLQKQQELGARHHQTHFIDKKSLNKTEVKKA